MKNLLAIFRLPDLNEEKQFCAVPIVGNTLGTTAEIFSIDDPSDNYNEMRFDHIVIAQEIPEGSHDIDRYAIDDPDGFPVTIFKMPHEELKLTVEAIINQISVN
jgi:hypothetical protein